MSDDDGKTWSRRAAAHKDYCCSSPIRKLSTGRLILPLYCENDGMAAGAVGISDDGASRWISITAVNVSLPKPTVIELADGRPWAIERSSQLAGVFCHLGRPRQHLDQVQPLALSPIAHISSVSSPTT